VYVGELSIEYYFQFVFNRSGDYSRSDLFSQRPSVEHLGSRVCEIFADWMPFLLITQPTVSKHCRDNVSRFTVKYQQHYK